MRALQQTPWALEAADCLQAVRALAQSEDLSREEIELRLAQYAESARGHFCPEAAFEPLAMRLRAVARLVGDHPSARADWLGLFDAAMLEARVDAVARRGPDAAIAHAA